MRVLRDLQGRFRVLAFNVHTWHRPARRLALVQSQSLIFMTGKLLAICLS